MAGAAGGGRGAGVPVGGMKKTRLSAGVVVSSALPGPVVYDPVALGVGDAGELV